MINYSCLPTRFHEDPPCIRTHLTEGRCITPTVGELSKSRKSAESMISTSEKLPDVEYWFLRRDNGIWQASGRYGKAISRAGRKRSFISSVDVQTGDPREE